MTDSIIGQFYDLMASHGCVPKSISDIVPNDRRNRISCDLDKHKEKTLTYQLRIDDDLGVGWFHSFKFGDCAGETVKFFSKNKKRMEPEEKAAWVTKMIEARQLQAAKAGERRNRQNRTALRLKRVIGRMAKASAHRYLETKNIAPHGIRLRKKTGELVIPVYGAGGLPWSVQKITVEGDKWFLSGASVDGGYYPLMEVGESKDIFVIAEGFATAATLRAVLGIPVLCAFNASNLKKVAAAKRKEYPDAKIVIAADNDRFTKNNKGQDWNPGIEKAKEAAAECRGFILAPDFPASDNDPKDKRTDWNDYVNTHGSQQLRDKMQLITAARAGGSITAGVVPQTAARPPLEINGDWKDRIICDRKGNLAKGSLTNLVLFLENHDKFRGIFRLNDFQKEIFVTRCPDWRDEQTFKVKRLDDYEIISCAAQMEQFDVTSDINKVFKAILHTAENNKFHPAREYFDSLVWDKTERLRTWLSFYLGAEGDKPEYLAFVGKKWLTAAVKRVYEPGCKFDHILVSEGLQGKGKSTALEYMATFGEEAYFTDNIKIADISKDNTILMLQGSLIVELAELAGFNKKDDEEIKGWITLKQDRCRRPYDKTVSHFPRQFVLSATTNSYDYLKDPSGNRRYWPFKSSSIDLEAIKRDRQQLWAEAVYWYKSGLYIGPTDEEALLAKEAQDKRRAVDAWEDDVIGAAHSLGRAVYDGFKVRDIFKELGLQLRDQDYKSTRRITSILQSNGFENEVKWLHGKSQRVWIKKKADGESESSPDTYEDRLEQEEILF